MNQPEFVAPPADDNATLPPHLQSIGAGLDFTDPNSPLAPYYMRTSDVVAAAFLATLFFLLNLVPLWHTDIWGHLKYGQWIVTNQRLPEKDVLCHFADPDATALHVYWLCQTGLYLVYHTGELLAGGDATQQMEGGVGLLRGLHAFLVVGRCLLLLLAMRRLGCPPALACFGLFVILLFSSAHVAVMRPQVLGEFFLACVLLAVSRKELSRRALVLLPLVLVLWANSHGSFFLGLIVLAGCLLGEIIRAAVANRSLQPLPLLKEVQIQRLGIALIASIVAIAILNPHGPFIYSITWAMGRHPNVVQMDEWQPLSFTRPNAATIIYIATIVLLIVTQLLSRDWFSPVQLVLMVGIGIQPLLHQRMMVWWLMLVPWLILPLLTTALERLPHYWTLPPALPSLRKTVIAGLLAGVLLLWSAPGQWLVSGKPWPLRQGVSQGTPWQLAQELKQPSEKKEEWQRDLAKGLEAYPGKQYRGVVFASETLGDYLAFTLPQDTMPILASTHVHLFTPQFWDLMMYLKRAQDTTGLHDVLARLKVNLVVVEAESHPLLCKELKKHTDWVVLQDETGSPAKIDPRCRLFVALRKKPQ